MRVGGFPAMDCGDFGWDDSLTSALSDVAFCRKAWRILWERNIRCTFISVVGGLMVLVPSDLLLGPAALTITMLLWKIWRAPHAD